MNPLVESIPAIGQVAAAKTHAQRMGGGEPHADCRQGHHRARDHGRQDLLIAEGADPSYPGSAPHLPPGPSARLFFQYSAPIKALRPSALLLHLALALVALGAASTAAAAPDTYVREPSLQLALFAKASHGYKLWVETNGHHQVALIASRSGTSATYTTTGRVSRKGIEADFGGLGEISVRFRGRLEAGRPNPQCHGRRAQFGFGTFRGTIRFRGEHGFASVDVSRAPGLLFRSYRQICKRERSPLPKPKPKKHGGGRGGTQPDGEGSLFDDLQARMLTVGGETEGKQAIMQAVSLVLPSERRADLGFTVLIGATLERRDGIRIERAALAFAGANVFAVSGGEGAPTRVGVVFPKPFEGRAKLVQERGEPSIWSGTLALPLPGAGRVPLTGPGLAAIFCQLSLERAETPCTRRADALLPATWLSGSPRLARLLARQESGSHSQALADVKLSWSRYWRNSASSSGFTE